MARLGVDWSASQVGGGENAQEGGERRVVMMKMVVNIVMVGRINALVRQTTTIVANFIMFMCMYEA